MAEMIGSHRVRVVDELERAFDDVSAGEGSRMVVLSAPSGEGKTRIVQEFYRRIAARQEAPRYWPEEIVDQGIDDWKTDRKRLALEPFSPDAVPASPGCTGRCRATDDSTTHRPRHSSTT